MLERFEREEQRYDQHQGDREQAPPEAGAQSHLSVFELGKPVKLPLAPGGRNRDLVILSRYMTPKYMASSIRKLGTAPRQLICLCGLICSIASVAAAQTAAQPPLSKVEQRIRDYVRAHQSDQVAFLEKAVNISSGTFNLAGV